MFCSKVFRKSNSHDFNYLIRLEDSPRIPKPHLLDLEEWVISSRQDCYESKMEWTSLGPPEPLVQWRYSRYYLHKKEWNVFQKTIYNNDIWRCIKKQSKGKFWFSGDLVKNITDSEEVSRDEGLSLGQKIHEYSYHNFAHNYLILFVISRAKIKSISH